MSYFIAPALTIAVLLVGARLLSGRWPWKKDEEPAGQSGLPIPTYTDLFTLDGGQKTAIQPAPIPDEVLRFLAGEDLEAEEDEPRSWDYDYDA